MTDTMTVSRPAVYTLAFCLFGAVATAEVAPGEFTVTQVAPGVYVHQGQHYDINHARRDDIANIGFIVGDRCVAVIDSGGSVAVGHRLRGAIRQITDLPICYVINTHVHYDHLLGNAALVDPGTQIIGHAALAEAVAANRAYFLASFAAELGKNADAASIVAPRLTVEDETTIDLGGRPLRLRAQPPAHTSADLIVYDLQSSTLWLGDLLFVDRVPVIDGSLKGWLRTTEKLRGLDAARAIPGHGPAVVEWPQALAAQTRYLSTLLKETREMIKHGGLMEQAIAEVGQTERGKWLLFDENHKRNVIRAFKELEWE